MQMISRQRVAKSPTLLLALCCVVVAACAESTPKISLSTTRVLSSGHVEVRGEGFTPKQDVRSHLRRPDGTEFPVLPILTDSRGEFTHDIDTLLLAVGVHELWVVDTASGVSSNVARFEVTRDP